MSVYFENLKMIETLIDPDKMPEKIFSSLERNCLEKFDLNF